jgi:hypothetical protein
MERYSKRFCLYAVLVTLAFFITGCGAADIRQKVQYVLCDETKLPDEVLSIIKDKGEESFAFSYSTNDYTYIAVGYGMHERDGYVVWLRDIFATNYACYVECAIMTQEYMEGLEGTYIYSKPSAAPYIVLRCDRLEIPVKFSKT